MLHQNKIVAQTSVESELSQSADMNDFQHLRNLLLGSEYEELLKLQREFSDHSHASDKISQVISEAIAIRCKQDDSVSQALVPSIEDAIRASVRRDPKRLGNALFPVMGPAIRESVAETVSAMMQQVNQLLENSLSARSMKWRINAFRTKRSFAEVMLSETVLYQVEQVFLIHRETGLLINHLTSINAIVKDPDMVSGMLTVVTDFVKDSFVVDSQQNVKSIEFGQLNLIFEAGPHAIIVAAVRGLIPADLHITIREQIEELHRLHGKKLEDYDGDAGKFPDTYEPLSKCLLSKNKNDISENNAKQKLPWLAIILLSLLVLLPLGWWLNNKLEENKWNKFVEQLQSESGIVVLNHHKHNGGYVVNGLKDPLAKDPNEIIAAYDKGFKKPISWNMQPYYSNNNAIVKRRLLSVLNPPEGVLVDFQDGLLTIKGEAQASWIAELSNKLPFIWGVSQMDITQLREREDLQQKIQQLVGSIEGVVIEFAPNSSELSSNDLEFINELQKPIYELQDYAKRAGRTVKLGILGFADASGTSTKNIFISDKRARKVQSALTGNGISEDILLAKGLGNFTQQPKFAKTLKCTTQRCVMFEVYIN
jgi:OOP family OmpA-OmpF porin